MKPVEHPAVAGLRRQVAEMRAERDRAKGISEGLHTELRDAIAAQGRAEHERDEARASNSRQRGLLECAAGSLRRIRTERDEARAALERVRGAVSAARAQSRSLTEAADRARDLDQRERAKRLSRAASEIKEWADRFERALDGSGT